MVYKHLGLHLSLALLLILSVASVSSGNPLSPNIPLDSAIYQYLEKLDGLGYLSEMQTGTKPYSRAQVAGWVRMIRDQARTDPDIPGYAQRLLERLEEELAPELAALDGTGSSGAAITLRGWSLRGLYYDGQPLSQPRTHSGYQPLAINNNGYELSDGFNLVGNFRIDGIVGEALLFDLEPRLGLNETEVDLSLRSGYLKTRIGNLQIQLGKEAIWWGEGERGTLLLTNNSRPLTALRLSNLEPIQLDTWMSWLNPVNCTFFYSELEHNRRDVPGPSFTGARLTVGPAENLTIGAAFAAIVGGEGRHLSSEDYWKFITGENATTAMEDKWNTIAGLDFRWRLPKLRGLQIYGELYGEDQAGDIIPWPSQNAVHLGIYLPRLTLDGRWEMLLEGAETTDVWYSHSAYREGWTYHGSLLGDAMGHNAVRYYLRLTRYFDDSSRLGFHTEYLQMEREASFPQTLTGFWFSYERTLDAGLLLEISAGFADIAHLNYTPGQSGQDFLLSVGLKKGF